MEYILVAFAVLMGAGLTFFSGFGLGTIMLPVFSIFFDVPVAIGATAIVHLSNNLFKFILVRKYIVLSTFLRFGIPAMILAAFGSWLLTQFTHVAALHSYDLLGKTFDITLMNVVVGTLMIFFAWFDLSPRFNHLNVSDKHLSLGGALSGFFGGISGHQGAFRSAFLSKAGLNKEQFVGTSNAISLTVDITRIPIYLGFIQFGTKKELNLTEALTEGSMLLVTGIVFAFLGTYMGKQLIRKTTITGVQRLVGILLFVMGAGMIAGIF